MRVKPRFTPTLEHEQSPFVAGIEHRVLGVSCCVVRVPFVFPRDVFMTGLGLAFAQFMLHPLAEPLLDHALVI